MKQEWFKAHYGGADGFDRRWKQPDQYPPKQIITRQWPVHYSMVDGELFLEPGEKSHTSTCVGMNLYSQLNFGLRPVDPNLFLMTNVTLNVMGKEPVSTLYTSGKGTSEIFWTSLVRNAKSHPLDLVGTSGNNFATLAKGAFAAYKAATSAEECLEPAVRFDLGYVIGNFLHNHNPEARAGPIWMSGGNVKTQVPLDCKGNPKVGDVLPYIVGTIVRIWKHLRLPPGDFDELLATAPPISTDEWLLLQSCVLVPKDEKLPHTSVMTKTRIYGIYDPAMDAIS